MKIIIIWPTQLPIRVQNLMLIKIDNDILKLKNVVDIILTKRMYVQAKRKKL